MRSTLLFLLLFSSPPPIPPPNTYSVTQKTSVGGSYLLASTNCFFFFFFSSTCLAFLFWCYLLKPKSGIQGATVMNCRSPVGEFHSLRRQSFQASLPWDFPQRGVLWPCLLEEVGGGRAWRCVLSFSFCLAACRGRVQWLRP